MLVDDPAVAAVVLVEGNAVDRPAQQLGKGRFPLLYRRPPQVVAVELEQVEGFTASRARTTGSIRGSVTNVITLNPHGPLGREQQEITG